MPQRFLRPGITTSRRFNCISYDAQSFFLRLMTLVDDFGRYDADPMLLRSHAFPFGDPRGREIKLQTIVNMCVQLQTNDLAVFYEAENKQYLQIMRWQEKPRAHTSKYPANSQNCKQMFADVSKCSLPSSSSSSSPSPLVLAIASTQPIGWSKADGWKGIEGIEKDFREAYPACDFQMQLKQADLWLRANPAKASKSNWRKFLTSWFKRSQDRGGDIKSSKNGAFQKPKETIPSMDRVFSNRQTRLVSEEELQRAREIAKREKAELADKLRSPRSEVLASANTNGHTEKTK